MSVIDNLIKAGMKFEKDSIDEYSRYKSWEFCYAKFKDNENDEYKVDELAIHLSLYLASWGMYRGSTFLINKNYKINCGIVEIIKKFQSKYKEDIRIESKEHLEKILTNDNFFEEIEALGEKIEKYYRNQGNIDNKNVTDTLKSKIIMGTLGITPAYDTYFKSALNDIEDNITKTFNKKSIKECYKYYYKHFKEFEELRKNKFKDYPIMKILDMCLWQYQMDKKDNKKVNP